MRDIYLKRQEKISSLLDREDISALVLCDREGMRDSNIKYLTGHPSDALLFIFPDNKNKLLPWDVNLADEKASVSDIVPYTSFGRDLYAAVYAVLAERHIPPGSRVELPSLLPCPEFMRFSEPGTYRFLCREEGLGSEISDMRRIKDEQEIRIIREASSVTDSIIDMLEERLVKESLTETDIALFIEREARLAGADGTGFETLAASPSRSCNIHAFPAFTAAKIKGKGFSIIDFGIKKEGYTTDVTVTAAADLCAEQERMIGIIKESAALAEEELKPGAETSSIAGKVVSFLAEEGFELPHALGHGIGLDIHEKPYLRSGRSSVLLEKGMVIAVEPGIYSKEYGGIRLENDYIITETGAEKITNSRIMRLDRC